MTVLEVILTALVLSLLATLFLYERARRCLKREGQRSKSLLSRYHRIIDTIHEGFWVVNPDTKEIIEVSPAICNMLGHKR